MRSPTPISMFSPPPLRRHLLAVLVASLLYAFCPLCLGATAELSRASLSRAWQQNFPPPAPSTTSPFVPANVVRPAPVRLRSDSPHPAVARVIVPEEGATSYGSGTLIDVRGQFGMVITNWHVVRDACGPVEVTFPGGFSSKARALKVDPDWDLAALVIWRPPIDPVAIADHAPRPGDPLTICGYGPGIYRAASGRCTQYYAPRPDFPQQMVELDVEARQGDSGGPIFNARGELAGVLFGAGRGTTLGSFGGRVDSFLATLAPDIGEKIAGPLRGPETPETRRSPANAVCRADGFCSPAPNPHVNEPPDDPPPTEVAALWPADRAETSDSSAAAPTDTLTWQEVQRNGWFEQLKTALAAIGLLALVVQVLRAAG